MNRSLRSLLGLREGVPPPSPAPAKPSRDPLLASPSGLFASRSLAHHGEPSRSLARSFVGLALALALPLACTKDKAATDTPDEFELPPEREVPETAKADKDKTKKGAKKGDDKSKQVTPPKVVVPQDRDQNLEKAKMAKAHKLSAKAKQLLREGQTDKAISEARLALREHEQNVEAMLVIAEAFYKQGKHELVLSVTNSILKVDAKVLLPTEKSQAYNLMGFAYLQAGQRGDAFSSFKSAAETDDKNASAWNNLGVQYMWRGQPDIAESCFEYATTLDAKFAEAYLNHGAALRANSKFPEAEKAFQQASKLRPDWAEVHFNLGVLYLDGETLDADIERRNKLAITELERYKTMAAKGGASLERSASKRTGPTDAMGNELVSIAQADLYIKAANKGIESEQRRKERDEKRKQKEGEPAESEPSEAAPAEAPPSTQPQKPGESEPPAAEKPSEPPASQLPVAEKPSEPSQPPAAEKPPPSEPKKPAETPPPAQPQKPAPQKPGSKPSEPPAQPPPAQPPASDPPVANPPAPQKPKPQKPGG
jgi:tetratricopeptide (TPR) repeat protein